MTINQPPPRKARVLTRLRINEVSMVDRGAGENCRVVISKRDGTDDNTPLTNAERTRAETIGRLAIADHEEMEARAKRERDDEDRQLYFDLVTGRTSVTRHRASSRSTTPHPVRGDFARDCYVAARPVVAP